MIEFAYAITFLDQLTGVTRTGRGVIEVDVNARRHDVISYAINEAEEREFGNTDPRRDILFVSVEPNERAA